MKSPNYSIDFRKRYDLRMGNRIFNCIYGILLAAIGVSLFSKESHALLSVLIILLGLFSLVYGLLGKELLITHDYLVMDSDILEIKRSFEKTNKIELSSATYIKTFPKGLEITFNDYVKTYDLSWISNEQFHSLKECLQTFCNENRITLE
jgi:hypothetical protein